VIISTVGFVNGEIGRSVNPAFLLTECRILKILEPGDLITIGETKLNRARSTKENFEENM